MSFENDPSYSEEQLRRAQQEASETSIEETMALARAGVTAVVLRYMRSGYYQDCYQINPEDARFGLYRGQGASREIRVWWTPATNQEDVHTDMRIRRHIGLSPDSGSYFLYFPDDPRAFQFTPEQSALIDELAAARSDGTEG